MVGANSSLIRAQILLVRIKGGSQWAYRVRGTQSMDQPKCQSHAGVRTFSCGDGGSGGDGGGHIEELDGTDVRVTCVRLSRDGSHLLLGGVAGNSGFVELRDTQTLAVVLRKACALEHAEHVSCACSADANIIACVYAKSTDLRILQRLADGEWRDHNVLLPRHALWDSLDVSEDGRLAIVAAQHSAQLVCLASATVVREWLADSWLVGQPSIRQGPANEGKSEYYDVSFCGENNAVVIARVFVASKLSAQELQLVPESETGKPLIIDAPDGCCIRNCSVSKGDGPLTVAFHEQGKAQTCHVRHVHMGSTPPTSARIPCAAACKIPILGCHSICMSNDGAHLIIWVSIPGCLWCRGPINPS